MKLIGVELNKQDASSDQWILTYRYRADSGEQAQIHLQKFLEGWQPQVGKTVDQFRHLMPLIDNQSEAAEKFYADRPRRYPPNSLLSKTEYTSLYGRKRIYHGEAIDDAPAVRLSQ